MSLKQLKQIFAMALTLIFLLRPGFVMAESIKESVLFLPEEEYSVYCGSDTAFSDVSSEEGACDLQEIELQSSGTLEADFVAPRISCEEEETGLLKAAELPEKYNSMEEGYVTSIKNQFSGTQTCWAFQYTQCMESDLRHDAVSEAELSPLGTAFFQYHLPQDPLGLVGEKTANELKKANYYNYVLIGGNSLYTMMTQSGWTGLTEEEELPYTLENLYRDDYNYADYSFDYVQTGAYIYNKADISYIKQGILEHGSAGVDLNAYIFSSAFGTAHFRSSHEDETKLDYYAFCTPSTASALKGTNHSMQIIGWDDTISREKFCNDNGTCPEHDGGWLIRNTGGNDWPCAGVANPGCAWVSYEDYTIGKNIFFFDAEPASNYLHNYHYDGNGSNHTVTARSAACLYQAAETEMLTHVNVGLADAGVNYTVEIYLSSEKPDSPTSGTLVRSQTGNRTEAAGLYTVKLDHPVLLTAGQWFSIVIRTDHDTQFFAEAEKKVYKFIFLVLDMIPDLKEGEGWLSMDGETFVDASGAEYLCCPRIKGFTKAYQAPEPAGDDDNDTPKAKETYSKRWFMNNGIWQILGKNGEIIRNSWVCDNAVTANGLDIWYFMDAEGKLLDAELAVDSSGNFYSFENRHNGYYGSIRNQDGVYTIAGQQVKLQFSHVHDGTYGRIINPVAIAFLRQLLTASTPIIPSEGELVFTATLQ